MMIRTNRQVILDAILATNPKLNYQLIENGEELISRLHAPEGHYPGLILLDLNIAWFNRIADTKGNQEI